MWHQSSLVGICLRRGPLTTNIIKRYLFPHHFRTLLQSSRILNFEYGLYHTAKTRSCIDSEGNPIPWYTYPSLEYLRQLDFTGKRVFEYGCGNSTLFWASVSEKVTSVESSQDWANKIATIAPPNVEIIVESEEDAFIKAIGKLDESFDVIIIDGEYDRLRCAKEALGKAKPGGMLILDNADFFPNSAKLLRNPTYIEVDFSGFGPIGRHTWTTSIFLHREFNFPPRGGIQPKHGIGSRKKVRDA